MQKMEMKKILNDVVWFKALALVLVITLCVTSFGVVARADTELTQVIPDFESYATESGYDLNEYPYYYIFVWDGDGFKSYHCIFSAEPVLITRNTNASGDYPSSSYPIYLNVSKFIRANINLYDDNTVSFKQIHSNFCTSYYFSTDFNLIYANSDVQIEESDGTISTFFSQLPLSQGQRVTIGTTISHQVIMNRLTRQIVSLIPLVIGLAVLAIGLRKALRMLLARLRRA